MFSEVPEKGIEQGELRCGLSADSLSKAPDPGKRVLLLNGAVRHSRSQPGRDQVVEHFRILLYGIQNVHMH